MADEKVINRDLILSNSNVLSAAAVLVILGLMVVPVPPVMLDTHTGARMALPRNRKLFMPPRCGCPESSGS